MHSDTPPTDTETPAAAPAPGRARAGFAFRKQRSPLSRDEARRQGDISQLAFLSMGGRDPAIAFLNGDDAELGGRPLALATASVEGFARVADAIRARAANNDA